MPKRTDIHTVLIIGAGPIVIGQACEFDYSGAQACKALREEGYRVVLVNSNPATIMTDPDMADATYIEPITPEFVEKIIARERPNVPPGKVFALLPTMGGQTALNTALSLRKIGALERHNIELIGATADAIDKAEDRERFKQAMIAIGLDVPKGITLKGQLRQKKDTAGNIVYDDANNPMMELSPESFTKALAALDQVGLPTVIRPSFTMGGTGGGIAYNREEFFAIVEAGLDASPTREVLIEESVLGWKEFEMEVVRDKADNAIIICSIENIDAMGVHTGDSITIAPALTLTDKEYQRMRSASIAVLREIGVETGGSNVQFAVNPKDGRMVVIEMNPRVSRSSALASKATGFPIAKIAAKLAVGYTLDELKNDITKVTPASFEPTIDYVVTKIPRFAFEKFPGAEPLLTTAMKSVGEAMAIGRTFAESMQKALRSLETGLTGFDETALSDDKTAIRAALARPTPDRLLNAAQAMRHGFPLEEIQKITGYDPWFLSEIEVLIATEAEVKKNGLPTDEKSLRRLKTMGFSDARLAKLTGRKEAEVRAARQALNIRPCYKRIDTCAAEFEALTPYMYSTYEMPVNGHTACEANPSDKKKIIILGGGPNRIGQGIEFDYCCCHAAFALSERGYETIMVNCNPETVSTDYDTSDRLYFEPLTAEDVLEIVAKEQENGTLTGVIVQFGGQTPLKLANILRDAGVPILGTSADAIDLAEDRKRFQKLLNQLGLKQPRNATVMTAEEAVRAAAEIGYPVILRPSYVLGGRGMVVVSDEAQLKEQVASGELFRISGDNPVLIDGFLNRAIEVDVDAICDADGQVFIAGIMEHIEEAGVHSGDSRLLAAAPLPQARHHRRDRAPDQGHGGRAESPWTDERAIRHPGRRDLRAGGQSPRQPHRALRRQGHRTARGRHRIPGDGGRDARQLPSQAARSRSHLGQGSGAAVRPLPRRGHDPGTGDAIHRRSDGCRCQFRPRLRQEPDRRRHPPAGGRHRLHLGPRCRQGVDRGARAGPGCHGLLADRHGRHGQGAGAGGPAGRNHQQGAGRPAACRGCPQERRNPPRLQHHRRRAGAGRFLVHPPRRLDLEGALLHHPGGGQGRHRGHSSTEGPVP